MIIKLEHKNKTYEVDLSQGRDISIPLRFDHIGPNCFYAPAPSAKPVVAGDFIGDTTKGGVVNFKNIHLNPHGNGTHTECVGHIATEPVYIHDVLQDHHHMAQVVSIYPTLLENGDRVITKQSIEALVDVICPIVIIRSLPNEVDKKTRVYSGTNPPYFEADALAYLREAGVLHFMTDLPSVDREDDDGRLAAHKAWWQYPEEVDYSRTITEMVYVPDDVRDGTYLAAMQIISLKLDASPSKIVLYALNQNYNQPQK